MNISGRTGSVATASGSRYMQQLYKHRGHKFAVEFDAAEGTINIPLSIIETTAKPDALEAVLMRNADGDIDRLQPVFEEHINRFAFREVPLRFTWQDVAAA